MALAVYTPKDWALPESITDVTLEHMEQGIKAVTDVIRGAVSGYQELTTDTSLVQGGSTVRIVINSNGVTYIPLGSGAAGDLIDVAAQCRHGAYELAAELWNGNTSTGTLIRRFSSVNAPYAVNVHNYPLPAAYADLRLYLGVYVSATKTDIVKGKSGSTAYTWLSGTRRPAV
jgi:hypothetical protein